jgi:hypothetical protein
MWDAKNRVQKSGSGLFFYSKREEAAWPFLFFNNKKKSRLGFPFFSTPYFAHSIQRQLNCHFYQWPKLHLSLDALSNQKILKRI